MNTRTQKLIEYIQSKSELIDSADKGSLEIHFSGEKIVPSIKIFDDIK